MKPTTCVRFLALALLPVSITLFGCGGAISLPDTVLSTQASGPAIRGRAYGGHSPIQGMHIYLVQPGTGYGTAPSSILNPNATTTDGSGFTTTANTYDPIVLAGDNHNYVTTNSQGEFDLTGLYSCTVNLPVYIYGYGGSPGGYIGGDISTIAVSTTYGFGDPTYTITFSTPLSTDDVFVVNQIVTIAGLTGDFAGLNGDQEITGTPTTTTFTFTAPTLTGVTGGRTYSSGTTPSTGNAGTASVLDEPVANPIVQLATLGNCPSVDGNFSGTIGYIYMNEVSTVATAYTFQPFTLASNNNAWDIGAPTTNAAGIENAALTAGQLYDIQGRGFVNGEGYVANSQTQLAGGTTNAGINQGNGIVPQATIDTLANILADCIDTAPGMPGYIFPQACTTLFNTATNTGETVGTTSTPATAAPTDTATAAINIARYPAGNGSGTTATTYVSGLYDLQANSDPYVPDLTYATGKSPNDFTIAINYPKTSPSSSYTLNKSATLNSTLTEPENIAIDSSGNIWITARTTEFPTVQLWSPLGVYDASYDAAGTTDYFGNISINTVDGTDYGWVGSLDSATDIEKIGENAAGTGFNTPPATTYGTEDEYTGADTVITNSAGDAYFVAETTGTKPDYELFRYSSTGALTGPDKLTTSITAGDNANHGAIENTSADGDLWLTSEAATQIARVTTAGTEVFSIDTGTLIPEVPAIDGSGNGWIPIQNATGEIYMVNPGTAAAETTATLLSGTGTSTTTKVYTGATLAASYGAAVDGNGNIWVTDRCGAQATTTSACLTTAGYSSLVEINGAAGTNSPGMPNQAISPTANYTPVAQYPTSADAVTILNDPYNLAIDPSGNIWITNFLGNSLTEVVGAAAPAVTPLSTAAGANELGTKP